jgi:hypothetical protein
MSQTFFIQHKKSAPVPRMAELVLTDSGKRWNPKRPQALNQQISDFTHFV